MILNSNSSIVCAKFWYKEVKPPNLLVSTWRTSVRIVATLKGFEIQEANPWRSAMSRSLSIVRQGGGSGRELFDSECPAGQKSSISRQWRMGNEETKSRSTRVLRLQSETWRVVTVDKEGVGMRKSSSG